MNPVPEPRNDRGLLFTVAGVVALGAIGLALLAGWRADRPQSVAAHEAAMPASRVATSPAVPVPDRTPDVPLAARPSSPAKVPGSTVGPEVAPPEPPVAVSIDPHADWMQVASAAFAARRYDDAIAYVEAELGRHPDHAYAHYLHGLSLWKIGRLERAAVELRRSAELNGKAIRAWVNLSRVENDRGEYAAALDAAERGLAIDPDAPQALFLAGRSLYNLDRPQDARRALAASVERDAENGFVQNLLGLVELQAGDAEAAVPWLRRAAELEPDVAYVSNNLGTALERLGLESEAAAAYARAVELDPDHARAAASLARVRARTAGGSLDTPVASGDVPLSDPQAATVATAVPAP